MHSDTSNPRNTRPVGSPRLTHHHWPITKLTPWCTKWHLLVSILTVLIVLLLTAKIRLADSGALHQCSLAFERYKPSEWELEWLEHAIAYQDHICQTLKAQDSLTAIWINSLEGTWALEQPITSNIVQRLRQSEHVFSYYEYRDSCSKTLLQLPIEPLVGLFRHPWVLPECTTAERASQIDKRHSIPTSTTSSQPQLGTAQQDVSKWAQTIQHVENKGHQLLMPLTPAQLQRFYPGRKYLFDIGTGLWSSDSLAWLNRWYGHRGIVLDEVWGWDSAKVDPTQYWDQFLPQLTGAMHFYAVPCPVDEDDERNPFNIIRKIYRPGDFIAVKLDIDNEEVEHFLINQLDAFLFSAIAEFFFEEHFYSKEMQPFFGKPKHTWNDTIHHFHNLRASGLRLHYWP